MRDFHVHSNYSDGRFLYSMCRGAAAAGLEAVGFADHCTVSERPALAADRARFGFNLDLTYERRRRGIEALREEFDVAIYDAVEMDYHPEDEDAIASFLEEAGFDYALGSVHVVGGDNVQMSSAFEGRTEPELDAVVDAYFDHLEALVGSELFDVAAHPDLIERTPALRGRATDEQYRRIADAFADSRTIPEINAGRALREEAIVHPSSDFLEVLLERGVPLSVATDAHAPEEIGDRVDFLAAFCEKWDVEPAAPPSLAE